MWWHLQLYFEIHFSYFTFHNFHLRPFVQNSFSLVSFFFGEGRGRWECIIVKKKKWFQNSTHLLFWRYMYFCNVLKNQYKKANTSINVAIALWLKRTCISALFNLAAASPNLRPRGATPRLLRRRAENRRQRSSQGVWAASLSHRRYRKAGAAAGLQRDADANSQISTLSWVNAVKIYVKKKKKKWKRNQWHSLYCTFVCFLSNELAALVGGENRHESSPTQKATIIKHLMIAKKNYIPDNYGSDVRNGGVSFIYNHTNAEHTQTIRSECRQSKWCSPSDFSRQDTSDDETRDFFSGTRGARFSGKPMGSNANLYILMHRLISRSSYSSGARLPGNQGLIVLFRKRKKKQLYVATLLEFK